MSQNLSSAAVVIGALRVNTAFGFKFRGGTDSLGFKLIKEECVSINFDIWSKLLIE